MAEDERAAIVVEAFNGNAQFTCQVDVVDGEGIMCLDRFHFSQVHTHRVERVASSRNRGLGHKALLCPGLTESQYLYLDGPVTAKFPGALSRGHNHAAASIGRMRLCAEADRAARRYRAQPRQPFGSGGIDAFIVCHRCQHFPPGKILHLQWSEHVTAMKGSVLLEGILILLVA